MLLIHIFKFLTCSFSGLDYRDLDSSQAIGSGTLSLRLLLRERKREREKERKREKERERRIGLMG
jgi:hypothetical protein